MTEDDVAERNQPSGNDKTVGPVTLPEGFDPECRPEDRQDDEPVGPSTPRQSEGALESSESCQQTLANPQTALTPDPSRQPAALEIQALPVGQPRSPFEAGTSVAPELSADGSAMFHNRGLALWLRWSARIVLATMILCGFTVAIGSDHRAAPGEVIANSGLRIVGGHFESVGNFGFGSGGPVGRIIKANGTRLRIDAAAADPHDATGEVMLYRFSQLGADGAATPYCQGDPGGLGFPMAGVWTAGVHTHASGQISVICLGTPAARCVALGYRPWGKTPDGADLWGYHQACVRALRADYCGTGQSHGDEQHGLALYDRLGIQPLRAADGMSFEAAWNADGAFCVNHMRAPARMTLKDLRTECANLPKARLGNSCDERDPALIFTKSPSPSAS